MSTDKGYTIIRDKYPPKPEAHCHRRPLVQDVDYGAMVRCECGAVFKLDSLHGTPTWFRTWPFYPEHPDFWVLFVGSVWVLCIIAIFIISFIDPSWW